MVEEKGVERVENKAINVIGCLDRGQNEDRRREREREGGNEQQTEGGENCLQAF